MESLIKAKMWPTKEKENRQLLNAHIVDKFYPL